MKITSEVFVVGGGRYSSPEDAAIYLISFEGRAAVVDAGCGGCTEKVLKNILSCGVDEKAVEYLLLTHCHYDHTGGAKELSDRLKCRVVAHELDRPFLERGDDVVTAAAWYGASMCAFNVDVVLRGARTEIPLGSRMLEAWHTPGHSPGSVVYLIESEGLKILFAQDVHGPLHPDLLSDRKKYLQSLERILSLEADILCEGHHGIYEGRQRVKEFVESFLPAT